MLDTVTELYYRMYGVLNITLPIHGHMSFAVILLLR